MLRVLNKCLTSSLGALALAATAHAADTGCDATPLLLQDVTIVDASGRWSDQDIFIENGRISAVGSDLVLETGQAVTVLGRPGAVVSPRPEAAPGAIYIRTATRAPSRAGRRELVMPGAPADLLVYAEETGPGQIEMEIRDGRIVGVMPVCSG
ncbi:MAG: hypothetical protein CMH94_09255 [Oceanicaulis sp.]|nr:hypothetical protein [Oceanicaulis sp.]MAZ91653.1 hypothetical protein [Maricaulis sp.]MBI75773.1 hypothetical protein [Oceanicaulis sp.]|tara:strand:- start:307 stop:765 length:459 start_codon:yes stop_codon:yes gene_type:complete